MYSCASATCRAFLKSLNNQRYPESAFASRLHTDDPLSTLEIQGYFKPNTNGVSPLTPQAHFQSCLCRFQSTGKINKTTSTGTAAFPSQSLIYPTPPASIKPTSTGAAAFPSQSLICPKPPARGHPASPPSDRETPRRARPQRTLRVHLISRMSMAWLFGSVYLRHLGAP